MPHTSPDTAWNKIRNACRLSCSVILILAGLAVAAFAIFCCVQYVNTDPFLVSTPLSVQDNVVAMMDAVCDGDYEEASTYMISQPNFGADQEIDNDAAMIIWHAFVGSTEYKLVGECYTTEVGLAQDIEFTYLDISSVTANLKTRSQELLQQYVAQAEDPSVLYDENNEYKAELIHQIMLDAVTDALEYDARYNTVPLTLNLQYQNGKWMVVGDKELLDTIFGRILF